MTTNDSLRAATLQTAAAPDEAGQEDDGAKTPTGVGSPKAATADSGSSPRPVAETVVAAPAPLTAANLAERTAAERSAADLDAAKSRSVSPKSPRSQPTFASFSGASSPFSQVPTTSKTSLGAADSSLAKVPPAAVPVFTSASLPLVTPEAPSPASSVRVEVASEAPGLSRQNSLQPASSPSTAGARISKLDKPSASVASKSPEPLAVPPPTPATNKTDLSNSQSPTLAIKPLSGIAERGANAASPTPSTSSSTSMGFGAFSGGSGFAAAKPTPAKPSSGFGGFSSSASPFGATPSKSFGTTSADIAGPSSTLTPSMRKMNDPSSKRTFGQIIRDGSPAEDGASTEDARKRLFSEQSSMSAFEACYRSILMHEIRLYGRGGGIRHAHSAVQAIHHG
ncbi:uncharacterized protein L969DRAFT_302905 [Mixia osmundae IAM 14324]|uniref:uncharacterized protein n=1 Tax=Mixia osmundae (strain CBS 9802 / IAM 14324 / JCM 22182 / KY 12970) TaxID=764103 RepID=UPI0004A54729|nr:uncharacterized protein L969DRAFT_302905 [Mixia osmundae IAM 14324]KEI41372.1 hypothetical protein L969DRAFT_302905 [Mixia osmundae IAM 14324]